MTKHTDYSHKLFKSPSLHLISAILTEIPEVVFLALEDDLFDKNKKVIVISYPNSQDFEVQNTIEKFNNRELSINLFNFNRNLNFVRDRLIRERG